jgi:DNA invertase Pin-like site-specific DNA recombinase
MTCFEMRAAIPGSAGMGLGSDRSIRPTLPRGTRRTQSSQHQFVSFRENLDTGGPLGRAVVIIVGAIAELERNLIIERVRAGMRRARLEGRHIGRRPLDIDRVAVLQERARGQRLSEIAKTHRISRATVSRLLKQAKAATSPSI